MTPPPGGCGKCADDFFLEMRDQRGSVRLAHLHQADDDRLAGLQQQMQELGRHLVVVALVGGDVDEDVGEGRRLHQTRDVIAGRPRRHVGTVPDDEVLEQIEAGRIGGDAADLIDVLIETGGTGLRRADARGRESRRVRSS